MSTSIASNRGQALRDKAKYSWLTPADYKEIISSFVPKLVGAEVLQVSELGFSVSIAAPPEPPKSGSLLLYDKSQTKIKFKNDGHDWKKKNGTAYAREDTHSVKFDDGKVLRSAYAHHASQQNFHRRTFTMVAAGKGRSGFKGDVASEQMAINANAFNNEDMTELYLVHYLSESMPDISAAKSTGSARTRRQRERREQERQLQQEQRRHDTEQERVRLRLQQQQQQQQQQQAQETFMDVLNPTGSPAFETADDGDLKGVLADFLEDGDDLDLQTFTSWPNTTKTTPAAGHVATREPPQEQPEMQDDIKFAAAPAPPAALASTSPPVRQAPSSGNPCRSEIVDISPEWANCAGGSKVVVVVRGALPQDTQLQCGFAPSASSFADPDDGAARGGVVWVDALRLGDEAIRCHVPSHAPGAVAIAIAALDQAEAGNGRFVRRRHSLSPPIFGIFSFRNIVSGRLASVQTATSPFLNTSASGPSNFGMHLVRNEGQGGRKTPSIAMKRRHSQPAVAGGQFAASSKSLQRSQVMGSGSEGGDGSGGGDGGGDSDHRENKIRIVEKLEKVEHLTKNLHASEKEEGSGGMHFRSFSSSSFDSISTAPVVNTPVSSFSSAMEDTLLQYRDNAYDSDVDSTASSHSSTQHYAPYSGAIQSKSATLQPTVTAMTDSEGENGQVGHGDEEELLDDAGLMELGDDQLEEVLERMLMRVVSQLVHVAAGDEDLRDELNKPDHNGFCLLHYACLYNLVPLVPVLVRYGARVDATAGLNSNVIFNGTSSLKDGTLSVLQQQQQQQRGDTPLHLAAAAGNAEICHALVSAGADVLVRDGNGLVAAQRAVAYHHHNLAAALLQVQQLQLQQNRATQQEQEQQSQQHQHQPSPQQQQQQQQQQPPPQAHAYVHSPHYQQQLQQFFQDQRVVWLPEGVVPQSTNREAGLSLSQNSSPRFPVGSHKDFASPDGNRLAGFDHSWARAARKSAPFDLHSDSVAAPSRSYQSLRSTSSPSTPPPVFAESADAAAMAAIQSKKFDDGNSMSSYDDEAMHHGFGGNHRAGENDPMMAPLTKQNLTHLQDAFSTLSLKEKCLISKIVALDRESTSRGGGFGIGEDGDPYSGLMSGHTSYYRPPSSNPQGFRFAWERSGVGGRSDGLGVGPGGEVAGKSNGMFFAEHTRHPHNGFWHAGKDEASAASEVASVITESDKESLDVAMAMMGPEELSEIDYEARILQKNMKAWIMRRNYKSMRESVLKLQGLWRESRRLGGQPGVSARVDGEAVGVGGAMSSIDEDVPIEDDAQSSGCTGGSSSGSSSGGSGGSSRDALTSSVSFFSDATGDLVPRVSPVKYPTAMRTNNGVSGDLNPMEQDICESTNVSGVKMDDDSYRREDIMMTNDDAPESRGGILTSIKNSGCIPSGNSDNNDNITAILAGADLAHAAAPITVSTNLSSFGSMKSDTNAIKGLDQRKQAAVQKLQANSRGMLARRNFGRIKRQTLAMIVIQRTLVRRNRSRRGNQRPPPAAHDSAEVAAFSPDAPVKAMPLSNSQRVPLSGVSSF